MSLAEFESWLLDNGAKFDNIEIVEFDDSTGRGVAAKTDIVTKDECVLSVPYQLMMNSDSARNSALRELFNDDDPESTAKQLSEEELLAVHLMYEKSQPDSFFALYIKYLPAAETYANTVFFTEDELLELKGSNLYGLTQVLNKQVRDDYDRIFTNLLFVKHSNLFDSSNEAFSFDEFLWALVSLWSHSFDLKVRSGAKRCLIPMADMFNHSIEAPARLRHVFNTETDCMEYRLVDADRGFPAGSQLFIYYGSYPNIKLLRLYGFVVHNNPNDIVELYTMMSEEAPLYQQKVELLQRHGLKPSGKFEIRSLAHRDTQAQMRELVLQSVEGNVSSKTPTSPLEMVMPPPQASNELLNTLRVQFLSPLQFATCDCDAALSANQPITIENELYVYMCLEGACSDMLAQYPTTLTDDERIYELVCEITEAKKSYDEITFESAEERDRVEQYVNNVKRRFALILRIGEKRVLEETLASVTRVKNRIIELVEDAH